MSANSSTITPTSGSDSLIGKLLSDSGLIGDISWQTQSHCKHLHDKFFPKDFDDDAGDAECLSICRDCGVREQCAEWALEKLGLEQQGVMGGATAAQRIWIIKHPEEAKEVSDHCKELGVDPDELGDWWTQVGPAKLKNDLTAKQVPPEYGVSNQRYQKWLKNRKMLRATGVRRSTYQDSPVFKLVLAFVESRKGQWVERTKISDMLQGTLPPRQLQQLGDNHAKGIRGALSAVVNEAIRSGERSNTFEQRWAPNQNRRRQVRIVSNK